MANTEATATGGKRKAPTFPDMQCIDCGISCQKRSSNHVRCDECSAKWKRQKETELAGEWRKNNPEKVKLAQAKHDGANREKRREKNRKWHQENKDRVRENHSKPEFKSNQYEYERKRRASDPSFRIRKNVSRAIRASVKSKLGGGWQDVLGYTSAELRDHLERQFEQGMSWDNYGEWHIDHIVPQALFKFDSIDSADFKACWALSNLRPLWSEDNQAKGAKRLTLL